MKKIVVSNQYTPDEKAFNKLYLVNLLTQGNYQTLHDAEKKSGPILRGILDKLHPIEIDGLSQMIDNIR